MVRGDLRVLGRHATPRNPGKTAAIALYHTPPPPGPNVTIVLQIHPNLPAPRVRRLDEFDAPPAPSAVTSRASAARRDREKIRAGGGRLRFVLSTPQHMALPPATCAGVYSRLESPLRVVRGLCCTRAERFNVASPFHSIQLLQHNRSNLLLTISYPLLFSASQWPSSQ